MTISVLFDNPGSRFTLAKIRDRNGTNDNYRREQAWPYQDSDISCLLKLSYAALAALEQMAAALDPEGVEPELVRMLESIYQIRGTD